MAPPPDAHGGGGGGADDAQVLAEELQEAMVKLVTLQEKLTAAEQALVAKKNKSRIMKDSVKRMEAKAKEDASAREEMARKLENAEVRLRRAENKIQIQNGKFRKIEEDAAAQMEQRAALETQVEGVQGEVKQRDAAGAALTARLQGAKEQLAEKAKEMNRVKALLAAAHAENETAIELEEELVVSKRAARKSADAAAAAKAAASLLETKCWKKSLECDQLRNDLAGRDALVQQADERVASARVEVAKKDRLVAEVSPPALVLYQFR